MTTKEQEFKALEKIRKIVSELGEDSYIAAAFEGCFEIAEDNIKNDFACSMKQRAESAEKKAEAIAITNRDLEAQLDRMKEVRKYEAEKADATIAALQQQIVKQQKNALCVEDLEDCLSLTDNEAYEAERQMKAAAQNIVAFAEDPTGDNFLFAVGDHREAQRRYSKLTSLRGRIYDVIGTMQREA